MGNIRLIDANILKETMRKAKRGHYAAFSDVTLQSIYKVIDKAPTTEIDESVIKEVLNKRCMTAVANEYLIALHGNGIRPQGEWLDIDSLVSKAICSKCQKTTITEPFGKPNFCPNCGARMQKGGARMGDEKNE